MIGRAAGRGPVRLEAEIGIAMRADVVKLLDDHRAFGFHRFGNERADRLAKAAARRAHLAHNTRQARREDLALDSLADSIVASIINRLT